MSGQLKSLVKSAFEKQFDNEPILISSPGRINLIGEHTDYNKGFVLPATIDKCIVFGLSKSKRDTCRIQALDVDETLILDLKNLQKIEHLSWKNYIIGVVSGILDKVGGISNFDILFSGNIPIGAGLSSSAALENGIAYGLNNLFDLGLSKQDILEISVQAERNFAGVNCGIMDQFTNLNGSKGNALFLNCNNMLYEEIPITLDKYQLHLINTNVKHQLSNSPFNKRKEECNNGYEVLKKSFPVLTSLSDANLEQLEHVRGEIPKVVLNRCKFVIQENERVRKVKIALMNQDYKMIGKQLFESHLGLRDLYEVSCDELDFLVDIAQKKKYVLGSRMMGGGFGGCTLNLIQEDKVADFVIDVKKEYQLRFGTPVSFYPVHISDGIHEITSDN